MATIWVEHLTAPSLLWLLLEAAARDARVLYDEHQTTRLAGRLLARLRSAGADGRFAPAELSLDARDAQGRALNYRREAELERLLKPACEAAGGDARDRHALQSFLANALMFRVTFLVMVEAKLSGGEHEALLARHPANGLVLDGWPAGRLRLRQTWGWTKHVKTLARPLRLLGRALLHAALGPRNAHSMETIRPSAWIQFHPIDFQGGYLSRAFWTPFARSHDYDRVSYFDYPGYGTPAARESVRLRGHQWVECSPPSRAARLGWSDLAGALAAFFAPAPVAWWHRWFRLEAELLTATWAAVFRRYRVKLLVQYLEFEWTQAAQARALERSGGCMMGVHWSDFPFTTEPIHITPAHVFFVWGENNRRWLELKGNDCRHILPSGAYILPREVDREAAKGLGQGFKLAFFDGSVAYNIYCGPESLSRYLLAMLGLLDAHPEWSAVLKPKGSADYADLPRGGEIMALIRRLSEGGRLIVAPRDVGGAGLASAVDLAVGFGLNSAATLAAIFGARAVHWDQAGWLDHPLHCAPGQKILYRDLDALRGAVEAAASGDRSIGDFTRFRRLANHFEDQDGPRRVAEWVDDYMARASREPAEAALEAACVEYRRRHRVPSTFTSPGSWWGAERFDTHATKSL